MALKYFSTVADSCHGHARTLTTALLIVFCSIALSTGLLRKRALLLVRVCLIHDRYQPLAKPLTRRFPKLMRERERVSMREKNDATPRNDRIAILRVSLSAGSFSPSLFFSFSHALRRRCTFLRFRSSRISIPPRFSLLFGILFHLNFYSSLIRFDISGLELWGIVNNRYRHYCFLLILLNFRI